MATATATANIKYLVLSGGGPVMYSEFFAVKYLVENHFLDLRNIRAAYGTSAGALVAVFLSLGYELDIVGDFLIQRPWNRLFEKNISGSVIELFSKKGLFGSDIIEQTLEPLLSGKDLAADITLEEFFEFNGWDIHIISLNLNTMQICDFNHKSFPKMRLVDAIYASACIPGVFAPFFFQNHYYVDGGLICNYPLDVCLRASGDSSCDSSCDSYGEILGIKVKYHYQADSYCPARDNILAPECDLTDYFGFFVRQIITYLDKTPDAKIPYEVEIDMISLVEENNDEGGCEETTMTIDDVIMTVSNCEYRKKLKNIGINSATKFLQST